MRSVILLGEIVTTLIDFDCAGIAHAIQLFRRKTPRARTLQSEKLSPIEILFTALALPSQASRVLSSTPALDDSPKALTAWQALQLPKRRCRHQPQPERCRSCPAVSKAPRLRPVGQCYPKAWCNRYPART